MMLRGSNRSCCQVHKRRNAGTNKSDELDGARYSTIGAETEELGLAAQEGTNSLRVLHTQHSTVKGFPSMYGTIRIKEYGKYDCCSLQGWMVGESSIHDRT